MIWAGSPYAQVVEFSTGLPTGAVAYQLLGNDGSVLIDDVLNPDPAAVSVMIIIPGANNGCATPLFETRTLTWNYTTATGIVNGRIVYRVNKPIPFAVTADGVRSKLGVEPSDLPDEGIDLVSAYANLKTSGDPSAYETSGDADTLTITHGIEALAALALLPALQVKIAKKESGGTNSFERFGTIDWESLEGELIGLALRARALLDSTIDLTGGDIFAFGTAPRQTDAITGA